MKMPTEEVMDLLLEYEVGGGESYYNKKLSKFTWPGGHSGPTIGIGIDTGYYDSKELASIFYFTTEEHLKLIQGATGKCGEAGRSYTKVLRNANIQMTWEQALKTFKMLTWPKFTKAAERAFPGLEDLKDNTYGAIVSLVFNRGTSMSGDARKEMRNIRALIADHEYKKIAGQLRAMKRIWEGKELDGLLRRREAEAKLVETCI